MGRYFFQRETIVASLKLLNNCSKIRNSKRKRKPVYELKTSPVFSYIFLFIWNFQHFFSTLKFDFQRNLRKIGVCHGTDLKKMHFFVETEKKRELIHEAAYLPSRTLNFLLGKKIY